LHVYYCIGLKFWKCGSRKIYAVREPETKRAITIPSDSSDDESDIPLVKRRKEGIDGIARDIKTLKSDVASLFEVSRRTRVPMGLKKMLIDTFRCTICQSTPMTPPIIFSKCCKSIIGCKNVLTNGIVVAKEWGALALAVELKEASPKHVV
jgi:hypothetical protein